MRSYQKPGTVSIVGGGPPRYKDARTLRWEELGRELRVLSDKATALHLREIVSDRPKIERILKERAEVMPYGFDNLQLAQLYDREGRYLDALDAWKRASHLKPGSYASYLGNPNVLARFGDIALHVGDRRLAAELYGKAGGSVFQSGEVDDSNVPDDDVEALREVAHYASGEFLVPHGALMEALAEFKIGMPLMQASMKARLSYGRLLVRLGHTKEAKVEFRAAEHLAPNAAAVVEIHRERIRSGLIQTETVSIINNGKFTSYTRELPDKD